jgi:hypothetical protein
MASTTPPTLQLNVVELVASVTVVDDMLIMNDESGVEFVDEVESKVGDPRRQKRWGSK